MYKVIIILVLVIYVLNKISSVIFRVAGTKQAPPNFGRRPPEGHVNVTTAPPKNRKGGVQGGEYVDYEEVK